MIRVRLFLKLFLMIGLPLGLVASPLLAVNGALLSIVPDLGIQPAQGLIGGGAIGLFLGALVGAAVAAIHVTLHFMMTDDPNVHHRRTLVTNASQGEAKRMCIEAIGSIPRAWVVDDTSAGSPITAKTGPNWRGWGDSITCAIRSSGPSEQTIVVESRPRLRVTVVDFGTNLDNVERIQSHLLRIGASPARDA